MFLVDFMLLPFSNHSLAFKISFFVSYFSFFASQRSYCSLHCELTCAIRFTAATFVAPYSYMVAPYLEFNLLLSRALLT
jgi:hypothetical protein